MRLRMRSPTIRRWRARRHRALQRIAPGTDFGARATTSTCTCPAMPRTRSTSRGRRGDTLTLHGAGVGVAGAVDRQRRSQRGIRLLGRADHTRFGLSVDGGAPCRRSHCPARMRAALRWWRRLQGAIDASTIGAGRVLVEHRRQPGTSRSRRTRRAQTAAIAVTAARTARRWQQRSASAMPP